MFELLPFLYQYFRQGEKGKDMKEKVYKFLPLLVMVIYCFITLKGVFSGRITWEDESHAWTMAGHCNLFQLIDLMRVEGHFLIWYLCIMPFAKFNFCYPYTMLLINWLFCTLAMIVMWYKAPFNNLIKTGITFSAPIIAMYSQSARCYSVGIMFLFLAMSLYKDRLNKPYKYLTCLVLTANTSLPMCIAAGFLGLMFVYDLMKNHADKKVFYTIGGILIFHIILFYFQFHGVTTPDYEETEAFIKAPYYIAAYLGLFKIKDPMFLFKIILLWIGSVLFPLLLFKSKRAVIFFMLTSCINILFFTFVYSARVHHICLIWIFAIAALWIFKAEFPEVKKRDWISIFFVIAVLQMILVPIKVPNGEINILTGEILRDEKLKSGKLYSAMAPISMSVLLPYLEKEDIYIYDSHNRNLSSYECLVTYFNSSLKQFNVDLIYKSMDDEKENYLLINEKLNKNYMVGDNGCRINMYLYKVAFASYDYRIKTYFYRMSKTELPNFVEAIDNSRNNESKPEFVIMNMNGEILN